ncbi:MAG: hypothetical protein OMM_07354, partial [Candidatus Magnetoglobus multicellularis str. Araruama]
NDPPVILDIPDQTILDYSQFKPVILDHYVEDIDNADSEIIWTTSGEKIWLFQLRIGLHPFHWQINIGLDMNQYCLLQLIHQACREQKWPCLLLKTVVFSMI